MEIVADERAATRLRAARRGRAAIVRERGHRPHPRLDVARRRVAIAHSSSRSGDRDRAVSRLPRGASIDLGRASTRERRAPARAGRHRRTSWPSSRPTRTGTGRCECARGGARRRRRLARRRRHRPRRSQLRDAGIDGAGARLAARPGRRLRRRRRRRASTSASRRSRSWRRRGRRAARRLHGRLRAAEARDRPQPQRHRRARLGRRSFARARELERAGDIVVRGIFSHLVERLAGRRRARRSRVFERGLERGARRRASRPELRHLAATRGRARASRRRGSTWCASASASTGSRRSATGRRARRSGLRPAMTLAAAVAAVRRVPAGTGRLVRLHLPHRARDDARARAARLRGGHAAARVQSRRRCSIGGRRFPVSGRIAMDQFVVDVGDQPVASATRSSLFGDPATGRPVGGRLGRGGRHHQLRDRHAHRRRGCSGPSCGRERDRAPCGRPRPDGRRRPADMHALGDRARRRSLARGRPRRADRAARRRQDHADPRDRRGLGCAGR